MRKKLVEKTCENCKWHMGDSCYRFPPVPICFGWTGQNMCGNPEFTSEIRSEFPEVGEDDFCGEWKASE